LILFYEIWRGDFDDFYTGGPHQSPLYPDPGPGLRVSCRGHILRWEPFWHVLWWPRCANVGNFR